MMKAVTEILKPFVGYIPQSQYGHRIVGPPSATLTPEQRETAGADSLSFRHTAGRKAGAPNGSALDWITDLVQEGALLPIGPAVVVYRQQKGEFAATGILGDLSLRAYESGRVKRHEKTIAKTQRKMLEYMQTTRVFGNPVATASRSDDLVKAAIAQRTAGLPTSTFTTLDGIEHQMWVVDGIEAEELCRMVDSDLYITDGHHRLAAAALLSSNENRSDGRIPAGVFSAEEFRLRSFVRCVFDPELDVNAVIARLGSEFDTEQVDRTDAFPRSRNELGARVGDRFFRVRIPDALIPEDEYASINTNLVQELVLRPIFGVESSRHDSRLQFEAALGEREPCPDADAWLLPFPLAVHDVMAVADLGLTMPPKSTWFAPKTPSGLVIRPLDHT